VVFTFDRDELDALVAGTEEFVQFQRILTRMIANAMDANLDQIEMEPVEEQSGTVRVLVPHSDNSAVTELLQWITTLGDWLGDIRLIKARTGCTFDTYGIGAPPATNTSMTTTSTTTNPPAVVTTTPFPSIGLWINEKSASIPRKMIYAIAVAFVLVVAAVLVVHCGYPARTVLAGVAGTAIIVGTASYIVMVATGETEGYCKFPRWATCIVAGCAGGVLVLMVIVVNWLVSKHAQKSVDLPSAFDTEMDQYNVRKDDEPERVLPKKSLFVNALWHRAGDLPGTLAGGDVNSPYGNMEKALGFWLDSVDQGTNGGAKISATVSQFKAVETTSFGLEEDFTPRATTLPGAKHPASSKVSSDILSVIAFGNIPQNKFMRVAQTVRLIKGATGGFGMSFVGPSGKPNDYRQGVYISQVKEGGAAERCGELRPGQRVQSINGVDCSAVSRAGVTAHLKAGDDVVLEVVDDIDGYGQYANLTHPTLNDVVGAGEVVDVTVNVPTGTFLGMGVQNTNHANYVTGVKPGGNAALSGQIFVGDRLLQVGSITVARVSREGCLAAIKATTAATTQVVLRLERSNRNTLHDSDAGPVKKNYSKISAEIDVSNGEGLGVGIQNDGKRNSVSGIKPGGNADNCGMLVVGDYLMKVSDADVSKVSREDCIGALKAAAAASPKVTLVLKRQVAVEEAVRVPGDDRQVAEADARAAAFEAAAAAKAERKAATDAHVAAATKDIVSAEDAIATMIAAMEAKERGEDVDAVNHTPATAAAADPTAKHFRDRDGDGDVDLADVKMALASPAESERKEEPKAQNNIYDVGTPSFQKPKHIVITATVFVPAGQGLGVGIQNEKKKNVVTGMKPGGNADKSGMIEVGDRLMKVNDTSVAMLCREDCIAALKAATAAGTQLVLILKRAASETETAPVRAAPPKQKVASSAKEGAVGVRKTTKIKAIITVPQGEGIGIGILHEKNRNVVSGMKPGGNADLCGKILVGDQVQLVNGTDVSKASREDCIAALKVAATQGGGQVTVILRREKSPAADDAVTHGTSAGTAPAQEDFSAMKRLQLLKLCRFRGIDISVISKDVDAMRAALSVNANHFQDRDGDGDLDLADVKVTLSSPAIAGNPTDMDGYEVMAHEGPVAMYGANESISRASTTEPRVIMESAYIEYAPDTVAVAKPVPVADPSSEEVGWRIAPCKVEKYSVMDKKKEQKDCVIAEVRNTKFNRYIDMLPNPRTRVKLPILDGVVETGYVNANYVRGPDGFSSTFVAAMAPMPAHIAQFWRLVWQEKMKHIIMLTGIVENGKNKCPPYWPNATSGKESKMKYLDMTIKTKKIEKHGPFQKSIVEVTKGKATHTLTHWWYTAWPDHGVPTLGDGSFDLDGLLDMVTMLHDAGGHTKASVPQLVHCSAGVGRTGVCIALQHAMELMQSHRYCDPLALIETLRNDRCLMVQQALQYQWLHAGIVRYAERSGVSCKVGKKPGAVGGGKKKAKQSNQKAAGGARSNHFRDRDGDGDVDLADVKLALAETRVDYSDGNVYTLAAFIGVYGGSAQAPPVEWTAAASTTPTNNIYDVGVPRPKKKGSNKKIAKPSWDVMHLTKNEALSELRGKAPGAFVLRATEKGYAALSLIKPDNTLYQRIVEEDGNGLRLNKTRTYFATLAELVAHYAIPSTTSGLPIELII
jgi:protein tyrosine phosphatase